MSEWKPIETAPKDGTLILVYEPDNESWPIRSARWSQSPYPPGRWDWFYVYDDCLGEAPTHWMPLPSPPETK